jgi:histidinol-phosphate aminotransferase
MLSVMRRLSFRAIQTTARLSEPSRVTRSASAALHCTSRNLSTQTTEQLVGQTCWANNPKYLDGTRLRGSPVADAAFNGIWVPNDASVSVLAESEDWVEVETAFEDRGWIRRRNLSTTERTLGKRDTTSSFGMEVSPYLPATSLDKITASEYEPSTVLKLDWNEGTVPPPPSVLDALAEFAASSDGHYLKWYPHLGGGEQLKQQLAEYVGGIPENLLVTNGSDDALILAAQTYLKHGVVALADCPTYEHFCVNAACTGASLIRLESDNPETADPDHLAKAIHEHQPRLVYLVSPNNPTGVQWEEDQISSLSAQFPSSLFIVDEAYHEFGAADSTGKLKSCASLAIKTENVVVTRTFSKAFCLASVRCGYVVAHPNTINTLRLRYNTKSVNAFAAVGAAQALKEIDSYYKPYWLATCSARDSFVRDMTGAGYNCKSGGGNFVSFEVPDGKGAELCTRLESDRIYIRDIGGRWNDHVRVSVGESEDMDRVAASMKRAGKEIGILPH